MSEERQSSRWVWQHVVQNRAITFFVPDIMLLLMQPTFAFAHLVAIALAHVELVVSSNSELLFA